MKSIFLTLASIAGFIAASPAMATDSTANKPSIATPAVQPYLLAHGKVSTRVGNYTVNIPTTDERCYDSTEATLVTSLSGIQWYGLSQGIAGVVNNLALNPVTYEIYGQLNAPVNVELARPNGATVTWEIWCRPVTTA